MFFGAIRTTIAECIYGMFGVPLAALVVIIYRAVFMFVMFEFGLLLLGGFMYQGQFRGFSPRAFITNFIDGNVVIHGTALKVGCSVVIGEVFFNKDLCGTGDVMPIFGNNMWDPPGGKPMTAAERVASEREYAAAAAARDRETLKHSQCELLYAKIGDPLTAARARWEQLSGVERAGTTWPDYFHSIEPELEAERASCVGYCPTSNGRGGYTHCDKITETELRQEGHIAEVNAAFERSVERMHEQQRARARQVDEMERNSAPSPWERK
jgi:hypothetical protein